MPEKLQQAIINIKSGNKQLGQKLLAQVLQEQPDNELGWLWMSAVVDEDKRKYCIERVLEINPNNQTAKQAFDKLNQIEEKNKVITPSSVLQRTFETLPSSTYASDTIFSGLTGPVAFEDENSRFEKPDKPKISITKAALRDGSITGILSGLLTVPFLVISALLKNRVLLNYSLIIGFAILISAGITTGIVFFRRKIGANLAVSLGGGLSGFISGVICGLTIAYTTNDFVWVAFNNRGLLIVMLLCGSMLSVSMGIFNSIIVWLPGIFIKRDKKVLSNLEKANLQIETEAINIKKYGDYKKPISPIQTPVNISRNQQIYSPLETKLSPPPATDQHETFIPPLTNLPEKIENQELVSLETKQQSPILSSSPQFWINPTRKGAYIIVLFNERLFTAKCEQKYHLLVAEKLSLGEIPINLLTEKVNISHSRLIKVEKESNSLKIAFKDKGNHTETVRAECKDDEMAAEIVNAIQQKLGSEVERTVAPMTISSILLGNGILITIILAFSTFFFYIATGIQDNGIPDGGSARTRGMAALLDLLGPGGVACIGGGLLLIILASMINSLIKPPLITTLLRKNMKEALPEKEPVVGIKVRLVGRSVGNTGNSPASAALSDGLMVGMIGGLIGLPLPILFLLTNNGLFMILGGIIDVLIFLFSGIAVGVLFYQRKLPRGSNAIVLGGLLGGAIAGAVFGLLLSLSLASSAPNAPAIFAGAVMFSMATALFGATTAWIPGFFIKPDPQLKPYDWRDGKTEADIARVEKLDAYNKRRFKNKMIYAGIMIAIIIISSLCKSLSG